MVVSLIDNVLNHSEGANNKHKLRFPRHRKLWGFGPGTREAEFRDRDCGVEDLL